MFAGVPAATARPPDQSVGDSGVLQCSDVAGGDGVQRPVARRPAMVRSHE
jgi:hypothetical protein